ncbi:hypothetical protein [Stenotrophomonas sp. VV52]|uniref:hypothetical protein n=1 Tax=Stenotrophomonas sp. VV52 TaxID=2066958 RepID=UPI0011AFBEC8|nr:hypothetical protein [Stenotrophomonas sp. VV52]
MKKRCTSCERRLRLEQFASDGKRGKSATCTACATDKRRMRDPLPPIPRDPAQVHINNAFNLWHGPVSRVLLRSHA